MRVAHLQTNETRADLMTKRVTGGTVGKVAQDDHRKRTEELEEGARDRVEKGGTRNLKEEGAM